MKKITLILLIALVSLSWAQPRKKVQWNDLQEAVKDSIRLGAGNISDSIASITGVNGLVGLNSGREMGQVIVKDTVTLKTKNADSLGTILYLKQLSSSNANGGGQIIYLDSATVCTSHGSGYIADGVSYKSATATKRWFRVEAINRQPLTPPMFGAKGDNSNDDTAEIQDGINKTKASTGLWMWTKGTYRVSSTIRIPLGVSCFGSRGSFVSDADIPRIAWYGAAGDTIFKITETDANFQRFDGPLGIFGASGGNRAGILFFCNAGIDMLDTFNEIQFHTADTLLKLQGVTNFHMRDFRLDGMRGVGIFVNQTGSSGVISLSDFTMDSGDAGEPCLLYLNMDPSTDNNIKAQINIENAKIEVNNEPANAYDGVIRVNNDVTSFPQLFQTEFQLSNIWIAPKSGVDSASVISFVNATDYFSVIATNFSSGATSTTNKIIHNSNTAPMKNYGRFPIFIFAPYYNAAVYAQNHIQGLTRIDRLQLGSDIANMFGSSTNPPYLKFSRSFTLKATPDSGMVEYDGQFMYMTNKSGTRRKVGSIYGSASFTSGDNVDTVSFVATYPDVVTTNSWANITFKSDPDTTIYVTFKADSMFVHYSGSKVASGTKTYFYEVK